MCCQEAAPSTSGTVGAQGSSAELRELAAEGLGELVGATGEAALRPFVVQVRCMSRQSACEDGSLQGWYVQADNVHIAAYPKDHC